MKFISTRGKSPAVTAAEALRRGLAPDGGLYVPDELPVFSASELEALYALPYAELSAAVLERFLPGFSREELLDYTNRPIQVLTMTPSCRCTRWGISSGRWSCSTARHALLRM